MQQPNAGDHRPVGFAGLATMVSNVDAALTSARRRAETSETAASKEPSPARPDTVKKEAKAGPETKSGFGSFGPVLVAVFMLVVFGLLYSAANTWSPPQSSQRPTTPPPSPNWAKQITAPAPSPPVQSTYVLPVEDRPPIGTGSVLSVSQIRYCLSENIRIEGARPVVNSYSEFDVERFNSMIRDYNSRCSNFRYQSGTLETARSEVERRRSTLLGEGRGRFAR